MSNSDSDSASDSKRVLVAQDSKDEPAPKRRRAATKWREAIPTAHCRASQLRHAVTVYLRLQKINILDLDKGAAYQNLIKFYNRCCDEHPGTDDVEMLSSCLTPLNNLETGKLTRKRIGLACIGELSRLCD